MAGGRPPKSLRLHAVSGAMEKNPQRFRDRQEQPDCDLPLGPPPEDFVTRAETSNEGKALVNAWLKISAMMALVGLGNAADELAVRLACQLKVRVDRSDAKLADFNAYRAMLNELGLTEAGRAKLQRPSRPGDPEDNEFGDFVRKPARRTA